MIIHNHSKIFDGGTNLCTSLGDVLLLLVYSSCKWANCGDFHLAFPRIMARESIMARELPSISFQ
jgi:hypothetical protein